MDRYIVVKGLLPTREFRVVDTLRNNSLYGPWIERVTTSREDADRIARLLNEDEARTEKESPNAE